MAQNLDDTNLDEDQQLYFNGIDAGTGGYLFPPMPAAELSAVIQDQPQETESARRKSSGSHYGVQAGIDASKLEEAGWGIIFAEVDPDSEEGREQEAIFLALAPLLALRKAQATKLDERRYKEYRGPLGYRPGMSQTEYFARRLRAAAGPVDPDKVPYYLLIVGSPQRIPFSVQYQLDVDYAVGRIHFETVEEYANYARSVVAAETGGLTLPREVAFVGVAHPKDPITQASRHYLVGPLADWAEGGRGVPGWKVSRYFDADASKANVAQLFGGPRTPALIFTASHGLGGSPKGDPLQMRRQGALVLQDHPGCEQPITEDHYFSGDDLQSDARVHGLIAFNFACYSAGTPQYNDYERRDQKREAIADQAFVAHLPRKLLGHAKGGALATIGHVERAWGHSFLGRTGANGASESQLAVFKSALYSLMKGLPVGMAVEYFNQRHGALSCSLHAQLEALKYDEAEVDDKEITSIWTAKNDARAYAVTGDPAVRLPLGG